VVAHPEIKLPAMNPRIHFRITETAFVSDFFIVSFLAGLGSVLCPPSDDSDYTSKRGENGLPHLLFPRKLGQEIHNLLQGILWLVTGNQRGYRNHGREKGNQSTHPSKNILRLNEG
jgi:hypothetical protein